MRKTNGLPTVVCIGGGTGTFVVLKGLNNCPVKLKAIVAMSDSGGSNKRIRDEFGLLPTSDIRQCFVALSEDTGEAGLLRKLFMYRFEKGKGIRGMTFGNLFMAALSDILGSQSEAIRQTGKVLRIHGTVIPVSFTDTNLVAEYENGYIQKEEHLIDEPIHDGRIQIKNIYLQPNAVANSDATYAIEHADVIIIGPGDLYTSVIPNLLVDGISESVKRSKAKKIYIMNLMTKYGQTFGFRASDHIKALEKYIGENIQYVILNTGRIDDTSLAFYRKSHETPVVNDLNGNTYFTVIKGNFLSNEISQKAVSDILVRSLIRHDSIKIADALMKIVGSKV